MGYMEWINRGNTCSLGWATHSIIMDNLQVRYNGTKHHLLSKVVEVIVQWEHLGDPHRLGKGARQTHHIGDSHRGFC
jgi:hypothetical protein